MVKSSLELCPRLKVSGDGVQESDAYYNLRTTAFDLNFKTWFFPSWVSNASRSPPEKFLPV